MGEEGKVVGAVERSGSPEREAMVEPSAGPEGTRKLEAVGPADIWDGRDEVVGPDARTGGRSPARPG